VSDLHSAFPNVDVQLQLADLVEDEKMAEHFRKHFRAFLHRLEIEEPSLAR